MRAPAAGEPLQTPTWPAGHADACGPAKNAGRMQGWFGRFSTGVAPRTWRTASAPMEQVQDSGPSKGRIEFPSFVAKHRQALPIEARQLLIGGDIDYAQGGAAQLWHTQQQLQRFVAKGAVIG